MCPDEAALEQFPNFSISIRVSCDRILFPEFSVDTLKKEIGQGTWMTDEYIQLLVKEKKYKEAIQQHVNERRFDKVEEFCKNH